MFIGKKIKQHGIYYSYRSDDNDTVRGVCVLLGNYDHANADDDDDDNVYIQLLLKRCHLCVVCPNIEISMERVHMYVCSECFNKSFISFQFNPSQKKL